MEGVGAVFCFTEESELCVSQHRFTFIVIIRAIICSPGFGTKGLLIKTFFCLNVFSLSENSFHFKCGRELFKGEMYGSCPSAHPNNFCTLPNKNHTKLEGLRALSYGSHISHKDSIL